jgi:hypothetical protein
VDNRFLSTRHIIFFLILAFANNKMLAAEIAYQQLSNLKTQLQLGDSAFASEIKIVGKIREGDYEKFLDALCRAPKPVRVALHSFGGDLVEGMKIGQLIRDSYIPTKAPVIGFDGFPDSCLTPDWWPEGANDDQACGCYSSCFVIWASGIHRYGGAKTLGIHRAAFDNDYFSNLTAPQAQEQYQYLLDGIQAFLENMQVPNSIIETMTSMPSGELHILTQAEFDKLKGFTPAISEWLSAKCGYITNLELSRIDKEGSTDELENAIQIDQCYIDEIILEQIRQLILDDECADFCAEVRNPQ